MKYEGLPLDCRQRLQATGRPYPRSSCQVCGPFSPNASSCDRVIAGTVDQKETVAAPDPMPRTVWKFDLKHGPRQTIAMPVGFQPLTCALQAQGPVIWARVDPDAPFVNVLVHTVMTGQPAPRVAEYVGTYTSGSSIGPLVYHVFIERLTDDR